MQHREPARIPHGNERSRRPWAVLGVLLAVLFGGLVGAPGCLNPRPEDDPSVQLVPGEPTPDQSQVDPVERETCEDNPLLAGCGEPDLVEPPQAEAPVIEPAPGAPVDADVPPGDAGTADAGTTGSAGSAVAE